MLYLQNISLAFGGDPIFEDLTWAIKPGQRIGLIGPNGAGKTTLLRIISGQLEPDGGSVSMDGGTTVGYLSQDVQEMDLEGTPHSEALHAFDEIKALEKEDRRLAAEMEAHPDHESDEYMKLVARFDRVHSQLLTHESHTMEARTEAVLHGLGFSVEEMHRPLNTFSGGWRMRVSLASILLKRPTVLLLDEPTNHLDIESIDWLEGYLKSYPGAVVLVSHDRYFLDRMVTRIAELANNSIEDYAGNYVFYLQDREERRALQQAAFDNQQKMIAEAERFIQRFRAKATKAKQAQSRIKMLEKLERLQPPPSEDASIRFRFPAAPPSGRTVVQLSRFSKSYPNPDGETTVVFKDVQPIAVEKGDKIALVGKNGAGKSTLARMLLGNEPFAGTREPGYKVVDAFFAQHQAEALDPRQDVLSSLREVGRGQSETELRSLLGAFLFRGDDVFKSVSVLSGGERSRLALARTLLSPANFLVLDEPTNHLDIASKSVLAEALRQYTGSFVLVSHDRYFIDQVVNKVWYVEGGTVQRYRGTFSDAQWQREHGTASKTADRRPQTTDASQPSSKATQPTQSSGGKKTKEQKRAEAEARNKLYQTLQGNGDVDLNSLPPNLLPRALELIEQKVAKQEENRDKLEKALADPDLYDRPDEFQATMARFNKADSALKKLYAKWEELASIAETAESS